mmetsp:Transcript_13842/g.19203  ORF Transcript_13842/g.19203 Transcript_13842/m.19203 type:complete len:423 (+) Transcript_13842:823-2091(+)
MINLRDRVSCFRVPRAHDDFDPFSDFNPQLDVHDELERQLQLHAPLMTNLLLNGFMRKGHKRSTNFVGRELKKIDGTPASSGVMKDVKAQEREAHRKVTTLVAHLEMLAQVFRLENHKRSVVSRFRALVDARVRAGGAELRLRNQQRRTMSFRHVSRMLRRTNVFENLLKVEPGTVVGFTFDDYNQREGTKEKQGKKRAGLDCQLLLMFKSKVSDRFKGLDFDTFGDASAVSHKDLLPTTAVDGVRAAEHFRLRFGRFLAKDNGIQKWLADEGIEFKHLPRANAEARKPNNSVQPDECKWVLCPLNLGENHEVVGVSMLADQVLKMLNQNNIMHAFLFGDHLSIKNYRAAIDYRPPHFQTRKDMNFGRRLLWDYGALHTFFQCLMTMCKVLDQAGFKEYRKFHALTQKPKITRSDFCKAECW